MSKPTGSTPAFCQMLDNWPLLGVASRNTVMSRLADLDKALQANDLPAATALWSELNTFAEQKNRLLNQPTKITPAIASTAGNVTTLACHHERQKREKRRQAELAISLAAEKLDF